MGTWSRVKGYLASKGFLDSYRGTSLIRNAHLLGPYRRNAQGHMVFLGGGVFLISEVPLYHARLLEGIHSRSLLERD